MSPAWKEHIDIPTHVAGVATAVLLREPGGRLSYDVECLPQCHFSGSKIQIPKQWPGSKNSDNVLGHPLFELHLSTMTSKFGM